jgi:hypothetical protein
MTAAGGYRGASDSTSALDYRATAYLLDWGSELIIVTYDSVSPADALLGGVDNTSGFELSGLLRTSADEVFPLLFPTRLASSLSYYLSSSATASHSASI